jgi:hypothetical protein
VGVDSKSTPHFYFGGGNPLADFPRINFFRRCTGLGLFLGQISETVLSFVRNMLTSLSIEGRIETTLRALNCSARAFENIVRAKGIKIPHATFIYAMAGTKSFENTLGTQLLEIANLMRDVQQHFQDIPIDWGQSEKVAMLLSLTMLKQMATEQGLNELAADADSALTQERIQ